MVTFSYVVSVIEAGFDAAVPDGPSVEQEGGREHDRGGRQGCADAGEGTYSSDDGSTGQLAQRVRPVTYRDDRRPHAGFESPVDPRQVQGVEQLAGQASEPESAEGECEATGQREDKYPPRR
jgi:hypothetical protein